MFDILPNSSTVVWIIEIQPHLLGSVDMIRYDTSNAPYEQIQPCNVMRTCVVVVILCR